MSREEADEMMHKYDQAQSRYRLAVRVQADPETLLKAFTVANDAREALIDRLCSEAKEAA